MVVVTPFRRRQRRQLEVGDVGGCNTKNPGPRPSLPSRALGPALVSSSSCVTRDRHVKRARHAVNLGVLPVANRSTTCFESSL